MSRRPVLVIPVLAIPALDLALAVPLLAAAGAALAQPAAPAPRPGAAPAPAVAERTAVVGVLDKRLMTTSEFTLRPGGSFRFGRLRGTMRTCETTAPWEKPQSAAFIQLVEDPLPRTRSEKVAPRTVFSGWLFAESPSLNPMRHPVYDVWLRSCTMRFPEGPKREASGSGTDASTRSPSVAAASKTTAGAGAAN
jgi:hypothetical protein